MGPDSGDTPGWHDVVIIGAGISGINTAYRLQTELPGTSYTILERRAALGGTWDLFRYPGIRSDSTLWTFGFPWRPWTEERGIAEGHAILKYMRESAAATGIDRRMRFGHGLESANWSSDAQAWRLHIDAAGKPLIMHCRFLVMCTGYYDYDTPLDSAIPGLKNFQGPVIHPQLWPENTDLAGKRVVVIGSGATAVTLVPALAVAGAAKVTMLQRSPSYVVTTRAVDPLRKTLSRWLSVWLTYRVMRLRSMVVQFLFLKYCTFFPARARAMLQDAAAKQLPAGVAVDPHFTPRYAPWEQRLCVCPDGDFYKALRGGTAAVATGAIKNVGPASIELVSGEVLEADAVVTATGLRMRLGGGAVLSVDGEAVDVKDKFIWKSTMLQDVPNAAFPFGYANLSWTLGADVAAWLVVRLLRHMESKGLASARPRMERPAALQPVSMLPLSSTYVTRGQQAMPKAATAAPWQPRSSYAWDLWDAKMGSILNCMEYQKASV